MLKSSDIKLKLPFEFSLTQFWYTDFNLVRTEMATAGRKCVVLIIQHQDLYIYLSKDIFLTIKLKIAAPMQWSTVRILHCQGGGGGGPCHHKIAFILATYTFQWLYRYCFRTYRIRCFRNITVFLWIYAPIYCYHCPYKHYLLPMCFKAVYILPLYSLCIYSCMYWKSGTSDLLVLMLFVLQCTDYK